MNAWDSVIIEVRRKVIEEMIVPKETEHFYISKDLKAGKLVFKAKERKMAPRNTNYLEYDTRTV